MSYLIPFQGINGANQIVTTGASSVSVTVNKHSDIVQISNVLKILR